MISGPQERPGPATGAPRQQTSRRSCSGRPGLAPQARTPQLQRPGHAMPGAFPMRAPPDGGPLHAQHQQCTFQGQPLINSTAVSTLFDLLCVFDPIAASIFASAIAVTSGNQISLSSCCATPITLTSPSAAVHDACGFSWLSRHVRVNIMFA